jgi:hypothetical protein
MKPKLPAGPPMTLGNMRRWVEVPDEYPGVADDGITYRVAMKADIPGIFAVRTSVIERRLMSTCVDHVRQVVLQEGSGCISAGK